MSMAEQARVGIVMGSDSDWPTMKAAAEALEEFDVPYEADVVSAHRMPEEMLAYGREAADGINRSLGHKAGDLLGEDDLHQGCSSQRPVEV